MYIVQHFVFGKNKAYIYNILFIYLYILIYIPSFCVSKEYYEKNKNYTD